MESLTREDGASPDVVADLERLARSARRDMGDAATEATGENVRPAGIVDDPRPLTEYSPDHPYIVAEYDLRERG